jgi:hypothetical protein
LTVHAMTSSAPPQLAIYRKANGPFLDICSTFYR